MLRVVHFTKVLNGIIHGTSNKGYVQKNQERYDLFKAQVMKASPDLRVQTGTVSREKGSREVGPGPITLDDVRAAIKRYALPQLSKASFHCLLLE